MVAPPIRSRVFFSRHVEYFPRFSHSPLGKFLSKHVSVNLNLASQPFRNRALPWTITALILFCSLTAIVWILVAARSTSAQAAAVQRNVDRLKTEQKQIEVQKTALKEAFNTEELLKLNSAQSLVDRKRFSWTRLLGDLEKSLPSNVRVTRIAVREVKTGGGRTTALLELTVIGKNPDDVTAMISDMDRTGVFQAEPVAQTLQKGRGETGTEWVLHVQYEQRGVSPTSADHNQSLAADMTAANRDSEVRR